MLVLDHLRSSRYYSTVLCHVCFVHLHAHQKRLVLPYIIINAHARGRSMAHGSFRSKHSHFFETHSDTLPYTSTEGKHRESPRETSKAEEVRPYYWSNVLSHRLDHHTSTPCSREAETMSCCTTYVCAMAMRSRMWYFGRGAPHSGQI